MRSRRYKKKGPVRSKKVIYDGITFQSGLEKYMYIALKQAGIDAKYEGATYELIPSFNYDKSSYERQANGKGEYKDRGKKKILNIKYTFPIRWKLFKMYLYHTRSEVTLYKPQNQKECDETVNLILGKKKT